jgi:hypothetical protein
MRDERNSGDAKALSATAVAAIGLLLALFFASPATSQEASPEFHSFVRPNCSASSLWT